MAQDVVNVVKDICALDVYANLRDKKYNIVGHSLGGKVALMVAAEYDKDNVDVIIAMDPVDDKPQELTAPKGSSPTTNLNNTKANQIHLLQSELGGKGFFGLFPLAPTGKNATAIKETYPEIFTRPNYTFFMNKEAKHMSYLDSNNDQASKDAREYVHELLLKHIYNVRKVEIEK
jgi:pimeloyl-ACP methyl ester carboxylesterase